MLQHPRTISRNVCLNSVDEFFEFDWEATEFQNKINTRSHWGGVIEELMEFGIHQIHLYRKCCKYLYC